MRKSLSITKNNRFIPSVVYLILLTSIFYYIRNFGWGGGIESFKLGIIAWPLVSLFGMFICMSKYFNKIWIINFGALYIFYNVILILFGASNSFKSIISSCVYAVLWFSLFVVFFDDSFSFGIAKTNSIIFKIALPIIFVAFMLLVNTYYSQEAIKTLNPIFYILYLLPFLMLEKNKVFKTVGMVLIFIAILVSYKRTAIIAFVLILLYYLYRYMKETNKTPSSIVKLFGVIFASIIGLYFVYLKVISEFVALDWLDRLASLEESGGAGRIERWEQFLADMSNSTALQFLFGHGDGHLYYHNDFMQVFFNFGIIGSILYTGFCIQLIILYCKMNKAKYKFTSAYGASLIIFFLNSAVGQVIVVHTWFLQMAVFWGIVIGIFYKEKERGMQGG